MDLSHLGKWTFFAGLLLVTAGGILWLVGKSGLPLGGLPGDVRIEGQRFSLYFPIATCIVLSIVLTLLLNVIARFLGK